MKSKEQILNEFGCPEIPFNETVTMYYPAILSAMEEYAHQSPPIQEGESVWVEVPVNERLPDKPDCYFVMWKLENGGAIIGEAMWDFEVKGKFDVSDDDDDDIQNPRGAQPTHWLERRTPQESKEGVEDMETLNKIIEIKEKERKEWADLCIKKQIHIDALKESKETITEKMAEYKCDYHSLKDCVDKILTITENHEIKELINDTVFNLCTNMK